jgi:hypothetical protein
MRDYVIEFVNAAVEEFQLDTFRTDFNIEPLENWRAGDLNEKCRTYSKQPAPTPAPAPARTCPHFTLERDTDVPAGRFGPNGTADVCELNLAVDASADACGAACCSNDVCRMFVFKAANTGPHPSVGGACISTSPNPNPNPNTNPNTNRSVHAHNSTPTPVSGCADESKPCCYLKSGATLRSKHGVYTSGSVCGALIRIGLCSSEECF